MRRGRLALKRAASEAPPENDRHRAAQPAAQPHAGDGDGASWATEFTAEVTRAGAAAEPAQGIQEDRHEAAPRVFQRRHQRQQQQQQQSQTQPSVQPSQAWQQGADELEAVLGSDDEGAGGGDAEMAPAPAPASPPASPPGDEEARQGLLKVVDSMRRRVDAGHLQLEAARRLRRQKQALLARGEAVLADHCAASWQCPVAACGAEQPGVEPGTVTVHSLQAECAAGQWWLHADVSLPWGRQQQQGGRLSLLAASTACSLMCRQQLCVPVDSSDGGGLQRLRLTVALDVQQQEQQQQQQQGGEAAAGTPWADVFLLAEQAAEPHASLLRGPAAAPPVLLGRVQLSWQEWLRSHGRAPAAAATQQQQAQQQQCSRALAVTSEQVDLACLPQTVQQHLGCVPAPGAAGSSSRRGQGSGSQTFVLPALQQTQAALPAAAVRITPHSPQFAEIELRAGSAQFLDALQSQLAQGLHDAAAAAAAAGGPAAAAAPPDSVRLEGSLLPPDAAAAVSGAADALVTEVDACIEWVEALLKHKLVLDGAALRPGGAGTPGAAAAEAQQRQAVALAAMAATDAQLVQLLS